MAVGWSRSQVGVKILVEHLQQHTESFLGNKKTSKPLKKGERTHSCLMRTSKQGGKKEALHEITGRRKQKYTQWPLAHGGRTGGIRVREGGKSHGQNRSGQPFIRLLTL